MIRNMIAVISIGTLLSFDSNHTSSPFTVLTISLPAILTHHSSKTNEFTIARNKRKEKKEERSYHTSLK